MKLLLATLLVLFVGAVTALQLIEDPGYVLIGVGGWTVEMSLAVLAVLTLLLALIFHYGLRLVSATWRLPQHWRSWRRRRHTLQARRGLTRGLVAMAEGEWDAAERSLLRQAGESETPLLHYLAAARAAHQSHADDRRDHYLRLAHACVPEESIAVALTQAELQLEHRQFEQAESTLAGLLREAPRHRHVLQLQLRLLLELQAWTRLRELLPALRRRKVIPGDEYRRLELRVYGELLDVAAADGNAASLVETWGGIPADLRHDRLLVQAHAGHLARLGRGDLAEPLLREALNRRMDNPLVRLYGLLEQATPARQLTTVEGWLTAHPADPDLLLAAGRIAVRNHLWGKARSAFEASLAARLDSEALRDLGALLEQLGEHEAAAARYREAAQLGHGVAEVPAPKAALPAIP